MMFDTCLCLILVKILTALLFRVYFVNSGQKPHTQDTDRLLRCLAVTTYIIAIIRLTLSLIHAVVLAYPTIIAHIDHLKQPLSLELYLTYQVTIANHVMMPTSGRAYKSAVFMFHTLVLIGVILPLPHLLVLLYFQDGNMRLLSLKAEKTLIDVGTAHQEDSSSHLLLGSRHMVKK